MVKGWDIGIMSMDLGERAQLQIASDYGYGDNGRPGIIPGGAIMVFSVDLLAINGREPSSKAAPEPTPEPTSAPEPVEEARAEPKHNPTPEEEPKPAETKPAPKPEPTLANAPTPAPKHVAE